MLAPRPWGYFLTVLDSTGLRLGCKLAPYIPEKTLVQLESIWVINTIHTNSEHLLNTQYGPGPGSTAPHVLRSSSQ